MAQRSARCRRTSIRPLETDRARTVERCQVCFAGYECAVDERHSAGGHIRAAFVFGVPQANDVELILASVADRASHPENPSVHIDLATARDPFVAAVGQLGGNQLMARRSLLAYIDKHRIRIIAIDTAEHLACTCERGHRGTLERLSS